MSSPSPYWCCTCSPACFGDPVGPPRNASDERQGESAARRLSATKCREIYEEHASGKNTARPQLEACLKSLRDGDTLTVWRLDRPGRSLGDLIRLTNEFKARGVGFASLTEQIDTRSPSGQLIFHVFGALAEFERNLIREHTLAGLKAAPARGRKGGRPKKLSAKDLKTVRALLKSGDIPVSTVAEKFHVARSTLYRNVGVSP
jgi:DNA invertase Pin-like site-specific DNA recombinase